MAQPRIIDKLSYPPPPGKPSQQVVARFESVSERTAVYKTWKKAEEGVRVRLVLTKKRLSLLIDAAELVESLECVDFVFADINCNTVAKLTDGTVLFFNTIRKLKDKLGDIADSMDGPVR